MKWISGIFLIILLFSLPLWASDKLSLNPKDIRVHFFYKGENLKISAPILSCQDDFIIKIVSLQKEESTFKTIEKVGGLIWMKVNDIHYKNVPLFYHTYSNKPVEKILSKNILEENNLGFTILGEKAEIFPLKNPSEKEKFWGEYLKYKRKYHLYEEKIIPFSCNASNLETNIYWPFQAPPGEYQVEFYEVSHGKIVKQLKNHIKVFQVGLVKFLADFSRNSPLIYGIFSVIIALISGFLVGLIFKKGGH
ncbi:MAG: TIGR02186 family protein [Caldimicrobium sp.]